MKQRRLLHTLIAVGAVLRAPPSSVFRIVNKARGVALWVVDANKAKAANISANNQAAAGTSGPASAKAGTAGAVEAPPPPLDVNLRASHLASKGDGVVVPVYGDALVTLVGSIDAVVEDRTMRPIRFRLAYCTLNPLPHHRITSPPHHLTTSPPHHLTTSPLHRSATFTFTLSRSLSLVTSHSQPSLTPVFQLNSTLLLSTGGSTCAVCLKHSLPRRRNKWTPSTDGRKSDRCDKSSSNTAKLSQTQISSFHCLFALTRTLTHTFTHAHTQTHTCPIYATVLVTARVAAVPHPHPHPRSHSHSHSPSSKVAVAWTTTAVIHDDTAGACLSHRVHSFRIFRPARC